MRSTAESFASWDSPVKALFGKVQLGRLCQRTSPLLLVKSVHMVAAIQPTQCLRCPPDALTRSQDFVLSAARMSSRLPEPTVPTRVAWPCSWLVVLLDIFCSAGGRRRRSLSMLLILALKCPCRVHWLDANRALARCRPWCRNTRKLWFCVIRPAWCCRACLCSASAKIGPCPCSVRPPAPLSRQKLNYLGTCR